MNRDALARLFAVTPGTVIRWARDGMPVAVGGGPGRQAGYRPSACVGWRLAQVAAKHAGGLNPSVERALRDRAQARLAEQLHRRREGDLLDRDEVGHAWSMVVAAVRARLLALPQALAGRCAAATDPAEVQRMLHDEVHSALRDLANWKVPEDPRSTRLAPRGPDPMTSQGGHDHEDQ